MSIMTRLRPNAELIISDAGEPIDQSETLELSQRELKGAVLAAAFAILSVGYALLAYGGVMLTRGDGLFAAVWMPNAIVLGVILHLNLRQPAVLFPTVFCGSLLGNWMAGFGAISAFGFSFANTGEVALAMYLLKKLGVPRPNMERMQDLGRFVLAAGLVAPALSASIAAFLITYDGGTFALGWINWFMADAMGMVLITPPLMIIADTISGRQPIANRQTAEWVSIIAGGTVVTAAVFMLVLFKSSTIAPSSVITILACEPETDRLAIQTSLVERRPIVMLLISGSKSCSSIWLFSCVTMIVVIVIQAFPVFDTALV